MKQKKTLKKHGISCMSMDVSYLHVFTYSERENTRAIDMKPVVPVSVRNERNKILRNLSFQKFNILLPCMPVKPAKYFLNEAATKR